MNSRSERHEVAIVDCGVGNLFSVERACEAVGMPALITSDRGEILSSRLVILPGVGAFGDAMATLRRLDLVEVLRDVADSGTMLVGICLGLQLLMSESEEFGLHKGLGIIQGSVRPLDGRMAGDRRLKVPQVGWNAVEPARTWSATPLEGVPPGEHFYFVHSFYVQPQDDSVVVSRTTYGDTTFCSSVAKNRVFACQFHPERSGPVGLRMYGAMRDLSGITNKRERVDVES